MVAFTSHRSIVTVQADGRVVVSGLPVLPGQEVEVIVFPRISSSSPDEIRRRLRGSVLADDDPFAPAVPPDEWEAAR